MRPAARINLIATVVAIALAVASGLDLPDRIPVHFDLNGVPDGWTAKWRFVASLVGMLVLMQAWLRWVVPVLMRRTPARFLSLPNRQFWTATPERRAEAARRIVDVMDWTGGFIAVTTLFVLNMVRQAAETPPYVYIAPRNQVWVLIAVIGAFTVILMTAAVREFEVPRGQR